AAPSSAAASSSTDRSTFSAKSWLGDTVTAATVARCHRSCPSISATAPLNLWRSRSFRLFTTCRLSFSACECSSRNSSVRTPTVPISSSGEDFASHSFGHEPFDDVALLDITVVLQRHAALHAALDFTDVVLEAPQ